MRFGRCWWVWVVGLGLSLTPVDSQGQKELELPKVPREFRGVWVASVWNLDWPKKAGAPVAQQQQELVKLLERAAALGFNAVLLQVRPACDALYVSSLEPWSPFLTGRMGRAPEPEWDPLQFAIKEAHQRGLELHAWINPFRAGTSFAGGHRSADHISVRRPDLVVKYGKLEWLDPGEPDAVEHVMRVVLDLVERYDLDGFHIDDYFYPYPQWQDGRQLTFRDDRPWQAYLAAGGVLSREDWRRQNINQFVNRMYREIKSLKPWVRVGISPFGIWRPGVPEGTTAKLDAYGHLFGDSLLWWRAGWVDYLSPQLYWDIESDGQPFGRLLDWWAQENTKQRHLWPGLAGDRVPQQRPAAEIVHQIDLLRAHAGASGFCLWSWRSVGDDQGGLATILGQRVTHEAAAVPAAEWLGREELTRPAVEARRKRGAAGVSWSAVGTAPRRWVVQMRVGEVWQMRVLPGEQKSLNFGRQPVTAVVVRGLDRYGNEGPAGWWTAPSARRAQ